MPSYECAIFEACVHVSGCYNMSDADGPLHLCTQPEADMETHQLLVADKLTVGELMTTAVLALPPLAPVRQVT